MSEEKRALWAAQTRAALIVAAMRRSVLTYGELGSAIGMTGVDLRNQMRHVLNDVSLGCSDAGEPSLAALTVNAESGEPGTGWRDGQVPWHTEVRLVFRHWSSK